MIDKQRIAAIVVGFFVMVKEPPKRDERGLSQSAETAIIVAAAVSIAIILTGIIVSFIRSRIADL